MNKMSKMHKRVIAAHGALLALAALPVGAALANASQRKGDFYAVPAVLD